MHSYVQASSELRAKHQKRKEIEFGSSSLNRFGFFHDSPTKTKKAAIIGIEICLTAAGTFARQSHIDLPVCCFQVVLDSREAVVLRNLSEPHFLAVLQQLWVILHQALQSCGTLESSLSLISILRINEFIYIPLCFIQCPCISLQFYCKTIYVSRQQRVSLFIDWFSTQRLEQTLNQIIFHINGQLCFRFMLIDKSNNSSHGLFGLPLNSDAVEIPIIRGTNSQKQRDTTHGEWISVLEHYDPLFAFLEPLLGEFVLIKQSMDIPMPMRFGFDLQRVLSFREGEICIVINHRWYFLLLHDAELCFLQSIVGVLLQQSHCRLVSVIRRHNCQRNLCLSLAIFTLKCQQILRIVLQECLLGKLLNGQTDFDSRISKTLSESPCNQNECSFVDIGQPYFFIVKPSLDMIVGNLYAFRVLDDVVGIWISSLCRFPQKNPRPRMVILESARISLIQFLQLILQVRFLLWSGDSICLQERCLFQLLQKFLPILHRYVDANYNYRMLRITKSKHATVSKPAKQVPAAKIPTGRIVNMIRRPVLEKILPSRKVPLNILHGGKEETTKQSGIRRVMYGNIKDKNKQNMVQGQLVRTVKEAPAERVIYKQKQTQIPLRPTEIETKDKKQTFQKQDICESVKKQPYISTQQQLPLENSSKDSQLPIARQSIIQRQPVSAEPPRFLSLPSKQEDIEADMQRIMARRQQREERKRQQKQREEMKRVEEADGEPHMMYLPNELEHFQMSIKQIDQQVSTLLRMKPSILAKIQSKPIRAKFEELQRFNDSYRLITEDDPANRLAAGLRNYMIALMNQIGEIIQQNRQGMSTIQVDNSIRLPFARTRGLSLEEMQSVLKLIEYQGANQDHHCAICLLNLESKTLLYEVSCGHTFHKACLEEWVITSANCPSCRRNFKKQ